MASDLVRSGWRRLRRGWQQAFVTFDGRSCLAGPHGPSDFAFLDKAPSRVHSVGHHALRVQLAGDGRRAVTLM